MDERDRDGLITHDDGAVRCWWCGDDPGYVDYHDNEWGRPVHDDVRLYEKLCLEGFQAGLSWLTILRKRPAFRAAFAGFDPKVVARFDGTDVQRLLSNEGIVRNRSKIEATIGNAKAYLELVAAEGSLDAFVWAYAEEDAPAPTSIADVRSTAPSSIRLSKELKLRGWRFVGPTTVYAFMQSMGLVNDHVVGCDWR